MSPPKRKARKKPTPSLPLGEAVAESSTPAGRTATQAFGPGSIVYLLLQFDVIAWTPEQVTAALMVAVPIWAFVQNVLERVLGGSFLIRRAAA